MRVNFIENLQKERVLPWFYSALPARTHGALPLWVLSCDVFRIQHLSFGHDGMPPLSVTFRPFLASATHGLMVKNV